MLFRSKTTARGLAYSYDRLTIENATASATVDAKPTGVTLRDIRATALGAKFSGQVELAGSDGGPPAIHAGGTVEGLEVRQAAAVLTDRPIPWNGVLSGTFDASAVPGKPLTKLNTEIGAAMLDPHMVKRLEADAAEVVMTSPEAFGKMVASEVVKWSKVARAAGIKAP